MLYLMPVAGVLIVLLHQMFHGSRGNERTNLILVISDERIPMATLPIFISTILKARLLRIASAGKRAALRIPADASEDFGDVFHMDERDKKVMIAG